MVENSPPMPRPNPSLSNASLALARQARHSRRVTPPQIFDSRRRAFIRQRMANMQARVDAADYILDDMVEDAIERLAFLRHTPARALVIGDVKSRLATHLEEEGTKVTSRDPVLQAEPLDEERPYPNGGFDLIASLGTLDTVNDLPGALIHIRHALAQGGLAICAFMGAGSLPALRQIMLAADGERPAARLHPMVDARAGADLLQRAGFADPVTDSHALSVRFSSLSALVRDLRAMGLSNALTRRAPPLSRAGYQRALTAFDAMKDSDGKVTERFEILTLTGRRR